MLRQCLTTLLTTDYPNIDITVVDNASTDNSITKIQDLLAANPRIQLIQNPQNVGHAEGCNIGARHSSGGYLVFLDNDIMFNDKHWLRELVNVMENDASVGLAQAKIVLAQDNNRLEYVCLAVDGLGSWAANYGSDAKMFNEDFEVLAASSGCCITRRDVFNKVGGFDADYFIYDDDTDLSMRIRLLGYHVLFVSSAVVIHRGGVLRGVSGFMLFHSSKNRLCTALKNYELRNVCWRFPVLSFFTLLVSAGFFVVKQHEEAKATLNGAVYPLFNLRKIWTKRLLFQPKRRVKDSELVNSGFVRKDFQFTLQDLRLKLQHM
jgi:hypothetical protein